MSLKGQRHEFYTDISFFMNQVAVRGGIATFVTVGSGAAMDQASASVQYAAASSGAVPIGMLMNDVVNYDLTRQHINFQRDEVQIGNKVRLLKKGFVTTNNIIGTPAGGEEAVLTSSGNLMPLQTYNAVGANYVASINYALNPRVGRFTSSKDEDGFAKVEVQL